MKRTLFILAVLCAVATAAQAQQAGQVYQCVRPDGTVVCTVTDTTGNPSVTCNHECVDCNMVCAARAHLTEGGTVPVLPPAVPAERRAPSAAPETREYCQREYQACVAKCKGDPMNRSSYDMDACVSSCNSWYSGCGMKP
ncbi:hypothetical protein [Fundidesulfovibrio terrae]|uniref:hypothetical protein n=1 Tax=Fundidesulfovibrio terrae TaxID=2922866 RepID=UPI001FB04A8B|nr:hypothetical protein [Fundidesulfovibrio terrae]